MGSWAAVPESQDWLGPAEIRYLAGLRIERRRRDWLLGRWTAKQAVLASGLAGVGLCGLDEVEILRSVSGAPVLQVLGVESSVSISLSHREDHAVCFLRRDGLVGGDLERIEPRSRGFVEDYFTPAEQRFIEGSGEDRVPVLANAFWSAKESLLKMQGKGLSVDLLALSVRCAELLPSGRWETLRVFDVSAGRSYPGWWCSQGDWVLTVVTDVASGPPIDLSAGREEG